MTWHRYAWLDNEFNAKVDRDHDCDTETTTGGRQNGKFASVVTLP